MQPDKTRKQQTLNQLVLGSSPSRGTTSAARGYEESDRQSQARLGHFLATCRGGGRASWPLLGQSFRVQIRRPWPQVRVKMRSGGPRQPGCLCHFAGVRSGVTASRSGDRLAGQGHNDGRRALPSRTAFPSVGPRARVGLRGGSPTGHDRRRPRGRAKASGDRLGGRAGPRSARAAPVRGVGSAWGSPSRSGPRRGGSASGCPGWRRGFRCVSCQLGAKAGACGGSPSRRSGLASGCLGAGLAGRGADRLGARKAPSSRGRSGVRPRRRDGWRRAGHDRRGPRGRAFIRRGEGLGVRASRGLA